MHQEIMHYKNGNGKAYSMIEFFIGVVAFINEYM